MIGNKLSVEIECPYCGQKNAALLEINDTAPQFTCCPEIFGGCGRQFIFRPTWTITADVLVGEVPWEGADEEDGRQEFREPQPEAKDMPMTMEAFLKECLEKNVEVRLVPQQDGPEGPITFYAHPMGVDGPTVDFSVQGNSLVPVCPE